ncbi:MAG TPA: phosphatase PAP2 family protein [Terriglobia bacterium]|nr:phosphatase PAP2 family protein [Terriglobia bacterium]
MTRPSTMALEVPGSSLVVHLARSLRFAEKVILAYLAYIVVASLFFPLSLHERLTVLGLNLATSTVVISLARFGRAERSKLLVTLRDWLPCFLILLAYRESGLFFRPDPTHRLDYLFVKLDDALLKNPWVEGFLELGSPWFQRYLEFAYFLCYPLVPLGLGSLYLARGDHTRTGNAKGHDFSRAETTPKSGIIGRASAPEGWRRSAGREESTTSFTTPDWPRSIDDFWTAVLLAALFCYVLYPFFPLTPPRELFNDLPGPAVAPLIRKTNFWLLGQYGVGASLFPSGHVAATTAMALVLRKYLPRAGIIFLIAAASIAAATVYGRYHYTADAVAGVIVGCAAAFITNRLHPTARG